MTKYFSRQLLYRIRNEIPLAALLRQLQWPHKTRDGRLCLVCPRCREFLTIVNPRTNLARCSPNQRILTLPGHGSPLFLGSPCTNRNGHLHAD